MTERYFEEIDPDNLNRLSSMRDTERAMAEYANTALQDSVVSVEIADCQHPFITLPRMMYESLSNLPTPPLAITGVDLRLNYDKSTQRFTTLYAGLRMDNNYSLIFHRLSSRLPNQKEPLFHGALLNPVGAIAKKTNETQLMTEKEVSNILDAVGIGLPKEPQEASWDEIKAILQFAGAWTASTSNSTPSDVVRTAHITDTVQGSTMNSTAVNPDIADNGIRSRKIVFAVDEAAAPTLPAHITWKITAASANMHETPCITDIQLIPLEFRMPVFEDYGTEILGEMSYVRHELHDRALSVEHDTIYLKAASEMLAALSRPKR